MSMRYSRRSFLQAVLAGGGYLGAAAILSTIPIVPAFASGHGSTDDSEAITTQTILLMGTIVSISVAQASSNHAAEAIGRAFAQGRRMEGVFTRFSDASPLGLVNRSGLLRDVPPELTALLQTSRQMHGLTSGAFDPTVLPILQLLENRRTGGSSLAAAEIRETLELVGVEHMQLDSGHIQLERQGMALTLDGIAKGHIVDAMSRELDAAQCPNHCINAGGDIAVKGRKANGAPWRIAVEDPRKRGKYPQVVELMSGGMATSGVYEVFYDAAHSRSHLINPATGHDTAEASATVVAPNCQMADALATAVSVMPARDALALMDEIPGCSCCLVRRDGQMQASRGWPGKQA